MKDDLISRSALLADLREKGFLPAIVKRTIERAPTVGPENLRPHGRWVAHGEHSDVFECTHCSEEVWDEKTPFCPYCGARMDLNYGG